MSSSKITIADHLNISAQKSRSFTDQDKAIVSGDLSESVKKIKREEEFIKKLKSFVDYGNFAILESFKIGLVIEVYPTKEGSES